MIWLSYFLLILNLGLNIMYSVREKINFKFVVYYSLVIFINRMIGDEVNM